MSEAGPTRAYVLHPDLKSDRGRRTPELALAEAVSLAAALPSLTVAGAEVVRVPRVAPGMLFGSGKVAELKARMQAAGPMAPVAPPVAPVAPPPTPASRMPAAPR